MKNDKFWNDFEKSGSVAAYLKYRNVYDTSKELLEKLPDEKKAGK